jgi:hypothetical protein
MNIQQVNPVLSLALLLLLLAPIKTSAAMWPLGRAQGFPASPGLASDATPPKAEH